MAIPKFSAGIGPRNLIIEFDGISVGECQNCISRKVRCHRNVCWIDPRTDHQNIVWRGGIVDLVDFDIAETVVDEDFVIAAKAGKRAVGGSEHCKVVAIGSDERIVELGFLNEVQRPRRCGVENAGGKTPAEQPSEESTISDPYRSKYIVRGRRHSC